MPPSARVLELDKEHSVVSADTPALGQKKRFSKAESASSLSSEVIEEPHYQMPPKQVVKPMMSAPLDLYDGTATESKANNIFRRATRIFSELPQKSQLLRCEHDESDDWTCKNCKAKVSQFEVILDDNAGKIGPNLRIIYDNQFLTDFLNEQTTNQIKESDSSQSEDEKISSVELDKPKKDDRSNPDVVYFQYEAKNVTELREYMFFCMSRQLQELESWQIEKEEIRSQQRNLMKAEMEKRNEQLRQQIVKERAQLCNADLIDIVETSPEHIPKPQASESFTTHLMPVQEGKDQLEIPISSRPKQYFVPFPLSEKLGNGRMKNISPRLTRFLQELLASQDRLIKKHKGNVLLFDSVFESGNLLRADRITSSEYRLYMQVDTNTKGHQQWFYFRVRNTRKDQTFKFMIMNFTKPGLTGGAGFRKSELYQRVMFKSKKSANEEWQVLGNDRIAYERTKVQRRKKDALAAIDDSDQDEWVEEAFAEANQGTAHGSPGDIKGVSEEQKNVISSLKKKKRFFYYALVFNVQFDHDDDIVYFAFSTPYPYSQIISEIVSAEDAIKQQADPKSPEKVARQSTMAQEKTDQKNANPQSDEIEPADSQRPRQEKETGVTYESKQACLYYRRQELCRTIGGLPVWMITISRDSKKDKKKPVVVVTSRVHAGETPASTVFKGLFDFLISEAKEAKFLRKFYTFVLIPCLNPDGVVCGNYRNCLVGLDLNRQWIAPESELQPEIFYTKKMLTNLTEVEKRQIWIYCDIHGHSKKQNAFFYGCNTAANGGFLSWTIVRLLPRIFAQKTHLFNIKDCRFKVEPYKIGTGRVVAWKQYQITHSFTLESSFYGYERGEDEVVQFTDEDYRGIGCKFAESIYEMHFVWKQIKRELQITNGWLKPKVLFETTGVPAAELLAKELEKKKKAELKQQAIEQYQLFLKKYYNSTVSPTKPAKTAEAQQSFLSQLPIAQNSNIPLNLYSKQTAQGKISKLAQVRGLDKLMSSNEDITDAKRQGTDEPILDFEKCLKGLVKFQARVRGMIARKRVEKLLAEQRASAGFQTKLNRKRLSSSVFRHKNSNSELHTFPSARSSEAQPIRSASYNQDRNEQHSEQSLDRELLNHLPEKHGVQESRDTLSGSGLERMSTRRMNLLTRDWRLYFQQKELDTAFQVVEIEQREISEEGSSAGSTSNPSEDNLEPEEIYEKVCKMPQEKRIELIKTKKEMEQKWKVQVKESSKDIVSAKAKEVTDYGKHSNARNIQTGVPSRRGTLKYQRGLNNKTNSSSTNIEPGSGVGLGQQGVDLSNQAKNADAQKKSGYSPYFHNNQNQAAGQTTANQNGAIPRNSSAQSPINGYDQNFSIHDYNMSTKNIAFNQINGRGIQINKYRDGTKNVRATTSHGPSNPLNAGIMQSTNFNFGPNYTQLRLFNGNIKASVGKRENINQVIKDCFITKKFGIKKPQLPQSSQQLGQLTNYTYEGNPPPVIKKKVQGVSENPRSTLKQEIQYTSSTGYYSNMGSSGKKARRIKRHKSPQSSQAVTQSMLMHLHPEFHYSQPPNQSLFMHPNYPFVAQQPSQLPSFSTADQQRMQLLQQARQQAMTVVQPNAMQPVIYRNNQVAIQQNSAEQPKRGQVVRVQISSKPAPRQTAQYIRQNQITHSDQLPRGFFNDN